MQLFDLDSSVPRQSFDWLVELAVRLNVVIEVLDVYDNPVCPVGSTRDAAAIRTMLTNSRHRRCAAPCQPPCDRGHPYPWSSTACRSSASASPAGASLAARAQLCSDDSADECREDLESIGPWLTGAIDASLAQPNTVSAEGYRIVSFRRILREASLARLAPPGDWRVHRSVERLGRRARTCLCGRRLRRILRVCLVDDGASVLVLGSRSTRLSCRGPVRSSG